MKTRAVPWVGGVMGVSVRARGALWAGRTREVDVFGMAAILMLRLSTIVIVV